MTQSFVNLHVHTAYSLLDSIIRIPRLVEQVKRYGQTACAITDHGTLAGAVKFTDMCLKSGIKPLIGQEFYIAPDSRLSRNYPKGAHTSSHLIIFAKNEIGWKNLMKLSSIAHLEGFYRKPRIDKEVLYHYSDGLIVTSACIGGDVAVYLKGGMDAEGDSKVEYSQSRALANAEWYMNLFEDDFYFEMQSYGQPYQEGVNNFYRNYFPSSQLICSSDCHYLLPEEADYHDTLLCCQTVKHKADPTRWRFVADQFFLKTESEMLGNFFEHEVYNTGRLADKIDFILPLRKQFYMPELPDDIFINPNSSTDEPEYDTPQETFHRLCVEGLFWRFGWAPNTSQPLAEIAIKIGESYAKRLIMEMEVFEKAQYIEYALLLWDLKQWCKEQNIFTGPGRGSGAGSLVLFALGITDVDPIKYHCPFERFINAGRIERFSPPDVDLDFPQSKRGDIIEYLKKRYGRTRVCQIGTYAALGPAAIIRKLKVPLGLSENTVEQLTAAIPPSEESVQGRGAAGEIGSSQTLQEVMELSKTFATKITSMGFVGKRVIQHGSALQFLGDHASTHASGLIITDRDVDELVPLMSVKGNGSGREVMSQMDMADVEAIGLVKYDILGIKTLDCLAFVQEQIKANHDPSFEFINVDVNDPAPYQLLHEGHSVGVFQVEGGGFSGLLPLAKPTGIEELSILTSLCRPGPMQAGITKSYIERKNGHEAVTYEIPQLAGILGRSFGHMIYQEDIMAIANQLAGYTLAEADDLRKIMGKKQRDKIAQQKDKFLLGLQSVSGIDSIRGENLWNQIESMAGYVFNRSHSISYSLITMWTLWAKWYYPSYFFAAAMTSEILGDCEELPSLMQDAKHQKISILCPDINESADHYHPVDLKTIRIGLRGIKGVGKTAVAAILDERKANGPYTSRENLQKRVPARQCNSRVVQSLDEAGCFDKLEGRVRRVTVDSLLDELRLFGFFLSGHPIARLYDVWKASIKNLSTIDRCINEMLTDVTTRWTPQGYVRVENYRQHLVRGIVTKYASRKSKSKSGKFLHFIDIEDHTGSATILLSQKEFENNGLPPITKGMALETFASRQRKGRANDVKAHFIRVIPLTP